MDEAALDAVLDLSKRSGIGGADDQSRPPAYKAVGIVLAVCSGLFIGSSFVLKKHGLLKANAKYNEEAGEGYGYLKNFWWWTGMTLMIVGELCNFAAYAFVDALLVTPLGALSVVLCTILSAIFLKERLSFVGKVGCFMCIVGSVIIAMNAPQQSTVANIQQMQYYVIAPGFLTYAGVIIAGCAFIAFWAGPRYGKKSMLVYLSVCSLIGGLSVVATQGLGSAIVAQASGQDTNQFKQWFLYVLLVFVVATLLTEIIYLNKALNIFNAAMVTPTYYVYFTSATIVSSAILFRGFKGSAIQITTMIMAFLQICAGVVLLQLSKSAKDVPDTAIFKGDLDQVRTIAEQEDPESEPRADSIRGSAALLRSISKTRMRREASDATRIAREKLEPIGEGETVEWDGIRRRKTVHNPEHSGPQRTKTVHYPLGLTHFPSDEDTDAPHTDHGPNVGLFSRFKTVLSPNRKTSGRSISYSSQPSNVPLSDMHASTVSKKSDGYSSVADEDMAHVYGMPPGLSTGDTAYRGAQDGSLYPPAHGSSSSSSAKRNFSFSSVFSRKSDSEEVRPVTAGSRVSSFPARDPRLHDITEEERLGLVKRDGSTSSPITQRRHPGTERMDSSESESEGSVRRKRTNDDPWSARYDDDDEEMYEHVDGRDFGRGGRGGGAPAGGSFL